MAKNPNIISGKTATGIKFQIDKRVKDDSRLFFYIVQMQKKDIDDMERGQALFTLLELLFGSGAGLEAFMNEVAAKHEGVADSKNLLDELTDILEALDVKNL